jgi:membrane-associated phospholipid phosphatase
MGLTQNSVKRSLYLCGIAVVVLFIMMSRLSAGRHFLSDVTVAVLFNSAIYAAGRLAFKKLNI